MAATRLNLEGPLAPTGQYSTLAMAPRDQALTWLSGQTGRDHDGVLARDMRRQTFDTFENIRRATMQTGLDLSGIIHLRSYLVDGHAQSDFLAARDEVMSDWYPDGRPPPSTLLVVSGLADPDALVEIEAVFVGEPLESIMAGLDRTS